MQHSCALENCPQRAPRSKRGNRGKTGLSTRPVYYMIRSPSSSAIAHVVYTITFTCTKRKPSSKEPSSTPSNSYWTECPGSVVISMVIAPQGIRFNYCDLSVQMHT